jgi:DNA polymerase-3 subunit gamma/tau
LLLSICEKDIPKLLETLEQVFGSGRDPKAVVESLIYRLSELTSAIYGVAGAPGEEATLQAALHETAVRIGQERLLKLRGELAEAHKTLRDISLPRLWLESELLKLAAEPRVAAKSETRPTPTKAVTSTEPAASQRDKPTSNKPEPKVTKEEPATPAHPAPLPSGDPAFDRAQLVWHSAVTELGEKSQSAANKLASTVVSKFENGRLEIRFDREIERDAMLEGPKGEQRKQAILESVRKHAGEDWSVEYSVGPKTNGEAAAPAVELPVEGERLVEMAKEILGGA